MSTASDPDASSAPRQRRVLSRIWRSKPARFASIVLALEVLVALFAPLIAPYESDAIVGTPLLPPGSEGFLLGTDDLGRDLLSRVIYGTQVSLFEGVIVVALSLSVALPIGLLAVEFKRLDGVIMRGVDALLALPGLLLALIVAAVLGPSLRSVLIAVSISAIPPAIVLIRATGRAATQRDFVLAARSMGASRPRVALRHVLPSISAPLIVSTSFRMSIAILVSTALSFLGLGAQPPSPEWGAMLASGRDLLIIAPHVSAFPGLAILITVLAFNLLGDGLRDVLDPKNRSGYDA